MKMVAFPKYPGVSIDVDRLPAGVTGVQLCGPGGTVGDRIDLAAQPEGCALQMLEGRLVEMSNAIDNARMLLNDDGIQRSVRAISLGRLRVMDSWVDELLRLVQQGLAMQRDGRR